MWQGAKQAAQLVLGTRADTTPELDEDEWTSLLGECKADANDREVAHRQGATAPMRSASAHLADNPRNYNSHGDALQQLRFLLSAEEEQG